MILVSGCYSKPGDAVKRAEKAASSKSEINIGIIWPVSTTDDRFVEGVTLARDEINRSGGILGRKLNLVIRDTEGSAFKELSLIHEFAENPDIVAVVGHQNSSMAVTAASLYQKSGILSMFTGVTSYSLTGKGHDLVFRNTGHDLQRGNRLAEYAARKKYKKIVIVYANTNHGRNLANAFENRCDDYEINIVDRRGYFKDNDRLFDNILSSWQNLEFEAVLLIGDLPQIGTFIVKMRGAGIKKPIIASDDLLNFDLKKYVGDSAEGMVLITPFHISKSNKMTVEFVQNMKKRFNLEHVDQFSALGYDGLKFLAYAMNEARSVVPAKVAEKIRSGISWDGATGIQKFESGGDIVNKEYDIVMFKNGLFEHLEH